VFAAMVSGAEVNAILTRGLSDDALAVDVLARWDRWGPDLMAGLVLHCAIPR
jgi:hypothetical protein